MNQERITLTLAEDSQLGRAGQVVTMALTPADVHDSTELPTYLAGYKALGFRADEASPPILVDNDAGKFRNFTSDDTFRRVDVKASTQSAIPEVDPQTVLSSYKVVDRLLGSFIPRQTEDQSGNAYSPRRAAARKIQRKVQLDRELDVWGMLTNPANWAAGNVFALGAGFNWGNLGTSGQGTSSDPLFDLQNLLVGSGQYVTSEWMNPVTGFAFLRHPSVRLHMRQMLGDGAVNETVNSIRNAGNDGSAVDFQIPGLPPIRIVASKVKNETTGALDFIVPTGTIVAVSAPPGIPQDGEEIATSYTFRRKGPSGVGFETREFFVDARGPLGGTMVVCSMADIAIMTGNNCGGLITGAVV